MKFLRLQRNLEQLDSASFLTRGEKFLAVIVPGNAVRA
jgi:hypothetical protein